MKNESKVGFQFDADLDDGLSATLQFMVRGEDDFNLRSVDDEEYEVRHPIKITIVYFNQTEYN